MYGIELCGFSWWWIVQQIFTFLSYRYWGLVWPIHNSAPKMAGPPNPSILPLISFFITLYNTSPSCGEQLH